MIWLPKNVSCRFPSLAYRCTAVQLKQWVRRHNWLTHIFQRKMFCRVPCMALGNGLIFIDPTCKMEWWGKKKISFVKSIQHENSVENLTGIWHPTTLRFPELCICNMIWRYSKAAHISKMVWKVVAMQLTLLLKYFLLWGSQKVCIKLCYLFHSFD